MSHKKNVSLNNDVLVRMTQLFNKIEQFLLENKQIGSH